jgi:hypothetical protein
MIILTDRVVTMVKWLMQRTHDLDILNSTPHRGDYFLQTIHFDHKHRAKKKY